MQHLFEAALMQEIQQFGIWQSFKEGNLIMDYGKYIRIMPAVKSGNWKMIKKLFCIVMK